MHALRVAFHQQCSVARNNSFAKATPFICIFLITSEVENFFHVFINVHIFDPVNCLLIFFPFFSIGLFILFKNRLVGILYIF